MSYSPDPEPLSIEMLRILTFLIKDHAFSEDFLATTVQEYITNNKENK